MVKKNSTSLEERQFIFRLRIRALDTLFNNIARLWFGKLSNSLTRSKKRQKKKKK